MRTLRKQRGFTAVAVLTLALGIGANTAIFTMINAVVLRPLPFPNSERFVHLSSKDPATAQRQFVSYPDFADWRRQSQSFERMAGWAVIDGMTLAGRGEPEKVEGVSVFGEFFPVLGVSAMLGATFGADREFQDAVVVLSHGLWQRRFNSDPEVIGQDLTLDRARFRIVGVMPQGFQFPVQSRPIDLWATFGSVMDKGSPYLRRSYRGFEVMGLLRPNVTMRQAQAEMDVIAAALSGQYPEDKGFGVELMAEVERLAGTVSRPLAVLFAAVASLLLIACVNVANLMLAKAAGRRHEMAVRSALGATRMRICRQLLTESLLLSVAGGIVGVFVAMWALGSLVALVPGNLPRAGEISIDFRVLGFTFIVSVACGILFGLAPAWHASWTNLRLGLQESARSASETAGGTRLRSALVVAEIALALMLLVAAGLLMNSFWRLLQLDIGIDSRNVASFMMNVPYTDPVRLTSYPRELQEQLQAIPGVREASVLTGRPASFGVTFSIDGRADTPAPGSSLDLFTVQPGFMGMLGIPILGGRDFTPRDDDRAPGVLIINKTFADRYFAGENPVGKRLQVRVQMTGRVFPMKEIVGVAGDARLGNPGSAEKELRPQMYFPAAQDSAVLNYFSVLVKTAGDPLAAIPAIRAAALAVDKEQPIYQFSTLDEQRGQSLAQDRFNAFLLTIFSGLALVLAAIGLFGVLSYAVAQRSREIGVRMALGAGAVDIRKMVLSHGLKLTLAGVLIGLAGALALTRFIEGLLFGVSATDPLTLALVTLLLLAVACLACWLPARRATTVDPIIALRHQ